MATLPGAERIRAITDEDGIFIAFDSYPWTKDRAFMSGLNAILGNPNTKHPQGHPADLAIHARIFYYAQRIGVPIDFARYKAWLARKHPDHAAPDVLPPPYNNNNNNNNNDPDPSSPSGSHDIPALTSKLNDLDTSDATIPSTIPLATAPAPATLPPTNETRTQNTSSSPTNPAPEWQAAAPKANLYVDRQPTPSQQQEHHEDHHHVDPAAAAEPAYPIGFAQMLDMIQKDIPIPGIRQIPDTVVRDSSVKPFGKRTVPKKPWEKDSTPAEPAADLLAKPSLIDAEFPPLDQAPAIVAEAATTDM